MDDIFRLLKDPALMDKEVLGVKSDAHLDRILKLMQIIYYGNQSGQQEIVDKIIKTYQPVIHLLAERMEADIREYEAKYGEI